MRAVFGGQRGGRRGHLARAHPPGVIAHLDLDAFFAAVEQLDRPELRGKPVVVGGDPRGRGVVSTASYEARPLRHPLGHERGRGLPALPEGDLRAARHGALSRALAHGLGASSASLVERFEQVGIDEGYLDLGGLVRRAVGRPRAARRRCRPRCATRRGSRARSAAARARRSPRSPATTASRAASSSSPPGSEAAFLAPLPLRALPGIGPRGEQRLLAAGHRHDRRSRAPGRRRAGRARHGQGRARPARASPRRRSAARRRRGLGPRHDRRGDDVRPRSPRPARDGRRARADRRERVRARRAARLRGAHRDDEAALRRLRDRHALAHAGVAGRAAPTALSSLAVELLEKALADRRAPVRLLGVYVGKLAREAQLELPLE